LYSGFAVSDQGIDSKSVQARVIPARVSIFTLEQVTLEFWRSTASCHGSGSQGRVVQPFRSVGRKGIIRNDGARAGQHIKQLDETTVFQVFYPADEYHPDDVRRNPDDPYVMIYAIPRKTRAQFAGLVKK
jgi:hypothetical protein